MILLDELDLAPFSRRAAIDTLRGFLNRDLPAGLKLKLVTYDGRMRIRVPFTDDVVQLVTALDEIAREHANGRRISIFTLSSDSRMASGISAEGAGIEAGGALFQAMANVADRARRSQAQIHWIRVLGSGSDTAAADPMGRSSAWRSPDEYREQYKLLKDSVRRSGGSFHTVEETAQTEPVFLAILQELREQYVLGYYPTNRRNDGAWHKVIVRVGRPRVDVRAAEGYIDF